MQHHSPQLKALHNRQWHITLSNHQQKVFNESNLNMVAFFVRPHIFKKSCDGQRHNKCPLFTLLLFAILFAFQGSFMCQVLHKFWGMFISNMLIIYMIVIHAPNCKMKNPFETWLNYENLQNFQKNDTSCPYELRPMHVNHNITIIQHEKKPMILLHYETKFKSFDW